MKKKSVKLTKKVGKMQFVEESLDEADSNYSSEVEPASVETSDVELDSDNVSEQDSEVASDIEPDSDNASGDESAEDDSNNNSEAEQVSEDEQDSKKIAPQQKRKQEDLDEAEIKAKKLKVKALFQPPSVQEINMLKETENSFHSNLFRLQIEEMLTEVKLKSKHQSFIENWLEKLNSFLEAIRSEDQGSTYENFDWLKSKNIELPIKLNEFTAQSLHFKFYKPSAAFLVGSCNIGTAVGPKFVADICIEMPSKTIQKDNHFNMTYFKKRAVYLCYIAAELKKFPGIQEMKFGCQHGDPFKPVLKIKLVENKKITIKLHVVCQEGSFKLNRFVPWNSNVRGTYFKGHSGNSPVSPTPIYNANVLNDLTMVKNENFIKNKLARNQNVRDGIMLVKIWMKQRGLDQGVYGFNMKLLAMFALYLLREQRIHASMSCYQVARLIWNNLAMSAWHKDGQGITMCPEVESSNQPTLEQFHEHYDIVFVDSTGFFNMAANLSVDVYMRVCYESKRAIELLSNPNANSFRDLFLFKMPFYQHCDHILIVDQSNDLLNMVKDQVPSQEYYDYCGNAYPLALKTVTKVLRKGLSDRIEWMSPMSLEDCEWNIDDKPKHKKPKLTIGFVLNPETAFDILTKGPQANMPEADKFRSFWGSKSELRRFQDSSITEACVWMSPDSTLNQKRGVCREIVLHLLENNLQLDASTIKYVANQLDTVFSVVGPENWFDGRFTDTENWSLPVIRAFDGVGKSLRELSDLPLGITSVQGISSVFRYCDPFPIPKFAKMINRDGKKAFLVHRISEGVIQLEISGKWPDDLAAIRRIKAAFLLQITKSLETDTEVRCNSDSVDILKDGYLFRIYIAIHKEIGLLKKEFSGSGIVQYRDTEESLELEKKLLIMPKLTSSLHAIYQRHYSFGPTVMIAKNWLYSQMIDSYLFPDDCTELLIAHQFHQAASSDKPNQAQAGFFRFLQLLAFSDWINELIFIDFNNEVEPVDISEIEKEFQTQRTKFPPLCLMTSYDSKRVGLWTKNSPSAAVLARVTLLARHTLSIIEKTIVSGALSMATIFKTSLDGYDLLIHLQKQWIQPTYTASSTVEYNHPSGHLEEEGFNAVQFFLRDLRQAYDEFAVFFYNPCEGNSIAVLWKPTIFEPIAFTTTTHSGRRLDKNGMAVCDLDAFLADFQQIGRGLIDRIEKLK